VLFHSIKHLQVVLLASGLHVQLARTKNLEMFRHVNHVMLALFKPHLYLLPVQDVQMERTR
jgi:hypothetical protein